MLSPAAHPSHFAMMHPPSTDSARTFPHHASSRRSVAPRPFPCPSPSTPPRARTAIAQAPSSLHLHPSATHASRSTGHTHVDLFQIDPSLAHRRRSRAHINPVHLDPSHAHAPLSAARARSPVASRPLVIAPPSTEQTSLLHFDLSAPRPRRLHAHVYLRAASRPLGLPRFRQHAHIHLLHLDPPPEHAPPPTARTRSTVVASGSDAPRPLGLNPIQLHAQVDLLHHDRSAFLTIDRTRTSINCCILTLHRRRPPAHVEVDHLSLRCRPAVAHTHAHPTFAVTRPRPFICCIELSLAAAVPLSQTHAPAHRRRQQTGQHHHPQPTYTRARTAPSPTPTLGPSPSALLCCILPPSRPQTVAGVACTPTRPHAALHLPRHSVAPALHRTRKQPSTQSPAHPQAPARARSTELLHCCTRSTSRPHTAVAVACSHQRARTPPPPSPVARTRPFISHSVTVGHTLPFICCITYARLAS